MNPEDTPAAEPKATINRADQMEWTEAKAGVMIRGTSSVGPQWVIFMTFCAMRILMSCESLRRYLWITCRTKLSTVQPRRIGFARVE